MTAFPFARILPYPQQPGAWCQTDREFTMLSLQTLFVIAVVIVLAYLLLDGWLTRAVWVKGARDGPFSFRQPAHKRERDEDPWTYWFTMGFYAVALSCLVILLLA